MHKNTPIKQPRREYLLIKYLHFDLYLHPVCADANSGSSRDWARMNGIPFAYTFELRDKGQFGFKLPEDQIQPSCEEAYAGAQHIITYVHNKQFTANTATGPTHSASTVVVTAILAVFITGSASV